MASDLANGCDVTAYSGPSGTLLELKHEVFLAMIELYSMLLDVKDWAGLRGDALRAYSDVFGGINELGTIRSR